YYTLKDNEIWIASTSDTTIDSRYFGPATLSQIEAHAYALL
ncbi:S26 family signal peptidase, partial [Alteromonas sp. BZK5]|nr:S26 family signal peptidase [Alteromonas sp. BZK5]